MASTEFSLESGIATICFNRPQVLNALDVASAQEFLAACEQIARHSGPDGVRVVVIRGSGRGFMAGGDLSVMQDDPQGGASALIEPMHRGLSLLAEQPAPVLASLQGAVAGAGLSLALGADLAIAAEDAVFNLAYSKVGASCDLGGSWALPRVVGLRRAMEISLLSDPVNALQALDWGLVNRVVPAAELDVQTRALALRLANGPTAAYGRMRQLMRTSLDHGYAEQLDAERDAFLAGTTTNDFREGVAAFLGRRKPAFRGN
ncbi:MAG: enoyl-CoA hydratase-related protein [Sulfuricaulis sp.]|nr:enoyl-CoA hydratase-related protein [Sulfuricaulis sp.]